MRRAIPRTAATALALSLTVVPAVVQAAELARCDRMHSHHAGERDTRDYGGGVISYVRWGSFPGDSLMVSTALVIVSCRAGQSLSVGLYGNDNEIIDPPDYDVSDAVLARFDEILVAPEPYSLADISVEMTRISPNVQFTPDVQTQPCGCAVAYPFAGPFDQQFDRRELR
ncbi:hypothetical protein HKCCE3408_17780 [Rhodobacterales bacterium HKCCE3408]|nr:hypothetical protein [Rhodobacterales bacterium HKCCE3408]